MEGLVVVIIAAGALSALVMFGGYAIGTMGGSGF